MAAELKYMKNRYFFSPGFVLGFLILLIFPTFIKAQISNVRLIDSRKNTATVSSNVVLLEQMVFDLINRTREENGLKKLIWCEDAAKIARMHSSNMANFNFFSHTGTDGKRVSDRADSFGLRNWRLIGENIAYNAGFENPVERAVYGWMNSPGHRQNILRDNWKETGIGIAVGPQGKYYITQVFLQRK